MYAQNILLFVCMKNLLCVRLLYCPTLTVGLSLVLLLYAVVIMISDTFPVHLKHAAHRLAVNAAHKLLNIKSFARLILSFI